MSTVRQWLLRLFGSFRGNVRNDGELVEELETHLQFEIDELVRRGMSLNDARREALIRAGGIERAKEAYREQRSLPLIENLRRDIGYAGRALRRSPVFTAVAVATLALGIGANTALFSIFSSLILRPLPVREPDSLALLAYGSWSYPIWEEINAREALFDGAFAWSQERFDLSTGGQSDLVDGSYVSGRIFEVLGVSATRGRMITPEDDFGAGADGPVAVISDRLWRQRFSSANDVVGSQLNVQSVPFTIVGVMPPGFFGPDVGRMADVMLPLAAEPLVRGEESRLLSVGSSWLQFIVRLKPGQTIEQTTAALRASQAEIIETATWDITEPLTLVPAATGRSALRGQLQTPLSAMVVAVGLVLLVACANLASLILARVLSRRRELSVRLALGSSRWRIARLLFIESLMVAVAGAGLGLMFASWSSALLVQQLSTTGNSVFLELALDWRVLTFTAAIACLSAVTAGLAPALGLRSLTPGEALGDAGRSIAGDRRFAVRSSLVVAQIGVSLALVVAAALFLRTFASLNRLPLGFVPEPLLVAELSLQAGGGAPEERWARVERLREAAATVPGARSVSASAIPLLAGGGWSTGLLGIGEAPISRTAPHELWRDATSPGWFETMGIPLLSGRDFGASDVTGSPTVAIVNETFVRQFMPGDQAVGQYVRLGRDEETRYEIVGIVGDAVYTSPRDGMQATIYVPLAQTAPDAFWETVLLTFNVEPGQRVAVERDATLALAGADPTVVFTFETFDQLLEATVTQERLIAMLSAFFGGLALLLAAVGLYGIVTHAVRARRAEIGLRMALGAAPSAILRFVFQRVGVLVASGLALGLLGSLWGARFVEALLFQVAARDAATFVGAAAVLAAVGMVAAWLPARRAARLDPATVLGEG